MKKENYRSDLDFILPYPMWTEGEDGKPVMTDIGWPDFDWEVRLWTWNRSNAVVVSRHGDTLVNCFNDGGRIHVVLDNHNLGAGKLMADYHSMLPDAIYPDGIRDLFAPMELSIELVAGAGDCPTEVEVEAVLPVIKGKDAYAYAVEHGYEGTEAEFGQSLAEMPNIFAVDPAGEFETPELPGYRRLFVDMWNTACKYNKTVYGKYNEATGFFELNGITDIGYAEALCIYNAYISDEASFDLKCRTNIPHYPWYRMPNIDGQRFTNTNLEIIKEYQISTAQPYGCRIANTHTLREITTLWATDAGVVDIDSRNLEYISFTNQNFVSTTFKTFRIRNAPKIRLDAMRNIVRYVRNSTVHIHADVYAKLTGDTSNAAAAALTPDELEQWQQVMVDAAGKNITFATT